jgi:hypothetical protein
LHDRWRRSSTTANRWFLPAFSVFLGLLCLAFRAGLGPIGGLAYLVGLAISRLRS